METMVGLRKNWYTEPSLSTIAASTENTSGKVHQFICVGQSGVYFNFLDIKIKNMLYIQCGMVLLWFSIEMRCSCLFLLCTSRSCTCCLVGSRPSAYPPQGPRSSPHCIGCWAPWLSGPGGSFLSWDPLWPVR